MLLLLLLLLCSVLLYCCNSCCSCCCCCLLLLLLVIVCRMAKFVSVARCIWFQCFSSLHSNTISFQCPLAVCRIYSVEFWTYNTRYISYHTSAVIAGMRGAEAGISPPRWSPPQLLPAGTLLFHPLLYDGSIRFLLVYHLLFCWVLCSGQYGNFKYRAPTIIWSCWNKMITSQPGSGTQTEVLPACFLLALGAVGPWWRPVSLGRRRLAEWNPTGATSNDSKQQRQHSMTSQED